MARVTKERKAESLAKLRELLPVGSTVYSVLRHVSASGMSRRIDFYKIDENRPLYLTAYVADALGYSLSYALHGMNTVGDDAIDAAAAGVPFNPSRDQFRAGYSLRHEWI